MKQFILAVLILMTGFAHAQIDGTLLFDDSYIHTIRITQADTNSLINTRNYQMVQMNFDGSTLNNIGFRKKGNISVYAPNNKFPFKIKTNKYTSGQEFDGIKEFTLHNSYQDPSMMREKLTYDICGELGLYALRTAFAKVYINGIYWGLYTIVEGKDEMYKQIFDNRSGDALESMDYGNMCYLGSNLSDYESYGDYIYSLDNGDDINIALTRFIEMLDKANNTPDNQYMDIVSSYFNIEHFIKYQAINVYLLNMDSYIQFRGNQIYYYDEATSQWQVVPWDFNASFSLWDNNNTNINDYPLIPNAISSGCIAEKINTVPELEETYINTICELAHTHCKPEILKEKINYFKTQIEEAVYLDSRKEFSNTQFDQSTGYGYYNSPEPNVPALKTFADDRYEKIINDLDNLGYNCSTSAQEITPSSISLSPNPTMNYLIVNSPEAHLKYIEIIDITGEIVYLKKHKTTKQVIDVSSFNSGIYFMKTVTTNNKLSTNKFIKL